MASSATHSQKVNRTSFFRAVPPFRYSRRRNVFYGVFALLLLILCFISVLLRPAAASDDRAGETDPFAEAPFILFDEEMLLLTQNDRGPATDAFMPNEAHFEKGEWRDLQDRHSAWATKPPLLNGKIGDSVVMLRDTANTPFLAQVWGGSSLTVSLTQLDHGGYKDEIARFPWNDADGAPVAAAGDCTGDGATELLVGYRASAEGKPSFLVARASSEPDPVFSGDPSLPHVHKNSGLRIAAGDVDGDGKAEAAALYVSAENKLIVALFSVDDDRNMRTLGTHELDAVPVDYAPEHFDIAFADWNGTGNQMILCALLPTSPAFGVKARLLSIEMKDGTPLFSTALSEDFSFAAASSTGTLRVDAGDMDGDGVDELIIAAPSFLSTVTPSHLAEVNVFYRTPYKRTPTGYRRTSAGIGQGFLLAGHTIELKTASFTGKLHPSAASKNKSQAVLSVSSGTTSTSLHLLSLRRDGDSAFLSEYGSLSLGPTSKHRLAIGDLDGDSMLLGTPTHITLENQITPLLFLNEPPKHIDPDASGAVTNYTRYSEMFIQYAQSETESTETTNTLDVESNIGASITAEEEVGVDIGPVEASTKEKTTISASVGAKYEDIEKDFSSQSTSLTGQTNRDDFVLYRCHLVDVWRYPVLGWKRKADGGASEGQAFYQVVIPGASAEDLDVHLIAGRNIDWYHPVHMNGNVLSYPSDSAQIPGFASDNLLSGLVTLDVGGGNSATRTIEWSNETSREKVKSLSVSMSVDEEIQFSASAKAEYLKAGASTAVDYHMDNRATTTASSKTSVTKENAFDVEVPAISTPLAYSVTPLMYTTEGGVLKTPHVVGNIAGHTAWTSRYASAPDPALNLPRIWMFKDVKHPTDEEIWEWVDDETENPDARKIRGIFFRNAKGIDLGAAISLGDTATIAVRVHNFSLTDCAPTTVRFEAAPYDPDTGETGSAFTLGTAQTSRIDRWGAQNPNWKETTLDWDTSALSEGNYKILVTVDPSGQIAELPGRALNEAFDNNRGWFPVFLHKKDSIAATERTGATNLKGGLSLGNAPSNGKSFAPGESVIFRGSVLNEGDVSVRSIKVLFFDGDPAKGGKAFAGKIVPGVLPGASYSLVVKHAFETPGTHRVHMRVVPRQGDPAPDDNTAVVAVQVGEAANSGGGCATGDAGMWSALFLVSGLLPAALRRKRR